MKHNCQHLIQLFDKTFFTQFNTCLVSGGNEPLYLPETDKGEPARIIFREDYFASALHELAHWFIAGTQRRKLEDWGYWYCPDGRNAEQQAAFEKVEVEPQAVEWALAVAAGFRFRVSLDNLHGDAGSGESFRRNVRQQVHRYLETGFPQRAATFIKVLQQHYGTAPLSKEQFDWS